MAKATLQIAADDRFKVFVNEHQVGSHLGWKPAQEYDVSSWLRPGKNVIAVLAENVKAAVQFNPAGLICGLEVRRQGGNTMKIVSDSDWRSSEKEEPNWTGKNFDDQGWPNAFTIAKYGDAPWGDLGLDESYNVPYAAGIPDKVRVVYIPRNEPVTLSHLETGISYHARFFNPQDGKWFETGVVKGDGNHSAPAPERPVGSPDWVLVLEASPR